MKNFAVRLYVVMSLICSAQFAYAGWGTKNEPWWKIFENRKPASAEEERLQRFWRDYCAKVSEYDAELPDWVRCYGNRNHASVKGGVHFSEYIAVFGAAPVIVPADFDAVLNNQLSHATLPIIPGPVPTWRGYYGPDGSPYGLSNSASPDGPDSLPYPGPSPYEN